MKKMLILAAAGLLSACGDSTPSSPNASSNSPLSSLKENDSWPYEIEGTLDIFEAGGYDDSDYPEWAYGELMVDGASEGIPVSLKDGIARRDRIDIDSGNRIKVWLNPQELDYGVPYYPIVKLEK